MKIRKSSIIIISLITLILSAFTVIAESDATGDVWHYTYTENKWSWELSTDSKPNIDIIDISYSIEGSQATLTMTVNGVIEDSETIFYYMNMVADDGTYQAWYSNGNGLYVGQGEFSGSYGALDNPVSGSTFTAVFDIVNSDIDYTVYGYSVEYQDIGDEGGESWQDYAPNSLENNYAPWAGLAGGGDDDNSGNGDTQDGNDGSSSGTPGFEMIALLIAISVALIIL